MKKLIFFISITLTLGIIFFVPIKQALVIYNRKNPSEKIISYKGYNTGFIISYTHSVNKGRVHDFYKTTDKNHLELYQTQFVSYGAGIPEAYETPGAIFEVTEDGYIIKNLNRKLPELIMAVGVIANHSITIGNEINKTQQKFLTEYFLPQTSLIFKIKRVSLFDTIKNKKI